MTRMILLVLLMALPRVWPAAYHQNIAGTPLSISSQIVDAIEDFKQQMPCGFSKYGIPPLAPFVMSHQEIEIDNNNIQAFGEINNFRLDGLNDFDIVEFKVNAILSRVAFKFNWNNVFYTTVYNMSTTKGDRGLKRSGPAKVSLKNITVRGIVKYNFGIKSRRLTIKEVKIFVTLGEVKSEIGGLSKINILNKKLNRIIEEWIMITVNDNTNRAADWINIKAVPLLNEILRDMSLSDILGIIGGSGEGNEKEPCIPSENTDLIKFLWK